MDVYSGTLKAVIFDWAGTIVDFGSLAPMGAFVDVFASHKIEITTDEARGPMGLPKLDHIRALGQLPRIGARWEKQYGRPFDEDDARDLLEAFVPVNRAAVVRFADLIPGALEAIDEAKRRGLRIGSTTGYTRDIMEVLIPEAARRGYEPECVVCADDLPVGRPSPLMMYRCFLDLQVYPAAACVKVDDTAPGISEGLAAGSWTVGVALSGNSLGLSAQQVADMAKEDLEPLRRRATNFLKDAGAHIVIDTVADLPRALDEIQGRLAQGTSAAPPSSPAICRSTSGPACLPPSGSPARCSTG